MGHNVFRAYNPYVLAQYSVGERTREQARTTHRERKRYKTRETEREKENNGKETIEMILWARAIPKPKTTFTERLSTCRTRHTG